MAKILIVEDESVVAWHIQESLENLQHTVVGVANSGAEAIELAAETKPELVLMDVQLEGDMDGVGAAEKIYNSLSIPIVYLTAHADERTLQRATTTDPFGYLVKPFQEKELHTTILVALRRHQREQNLKATKQWLATTLTSIGDGTIATDVNGSITFINPVAEALTGWQRQEAIGEDVNKVFTLVSEETRQAIENPGMRAMRLNAAVSLPERCLLRAKNGIERPVGDTAAPIKNDLGEVIGSIVIFKDITPQTQEKAKLEQRNNILEDYQLTLLAQLRERTRQLEQALAITQVIKRITDRADESLDRHQILQLTIEELGRALEADWCWVAMYDEEYAIATITCEYISSDIEHLKASDTKINLQCYPYFYLHLFQKQCWLSPPREILPEAYQSFLTSTSQLLVCPICNDDQVIGEVAIVTSGKLPWSQSQAELVSQALEQTSAAMRQTCLQQAAQAHMGELELLNNLKYDFISSVSHELRTPLANMKMAIEMLSIIIRSIKIADKSQEELQNKNLLWSRLDQYLHILQEECQQELTLVNDLLNFQSDEASTENLSLSLINFQEWLPWILNRFAVQTAQQRLTMTYEILPQLPIVAPHLPSLERIITELLNNACKFTPPNQHISVSVEIEADQLIFKVSNTGIEIPFEEQERIFDAFYRIPYPNPWNYSGTGLGLALVKKLVRRLDGDVRVESRNGKTTFIVSLPLVI